MNDLDNVTMFSEETKCYTPICACKDEFGQPRCSFFKADSDVGPVEVADVDVTIEVNREILAGLPAAQCTLVNLGSYVPATVKNATPLSIYSGVRRFTEFTR